MVLRKELIGSIVNHKCKNGVTMRFVIKQSEASLYQELGLDVFEKLPRSESKVTEVKVKKNVASKK